MFAVCIESSHARGLGHLYRSLTLADAMRAGGLTLRFLMNDHASSVELVRNRGYGVDVVDLANETGGWEEAWVAYHPEVRVWINDRLDTTAGHAERVKAAGLRLVTFDDRGGGATLADLHIAALAFDDAHVLAGHKVLHGVDYLILDPDLGRRRRLRTRVESVLVTLGGSDTWGVTPRVMQWLMERRRPATVVLGPAFAHDEEVARLMREAHSSLLTVRRGVSSLADEMDRHDLAITGGGMSPFQANASGLPCIIVANEVFEVPVGRALARLGGAVFAGHHSEMVLPLLEDLSVPVMSRAGIEAIDLKGSARVIESMRELVQ
jgi:spore coat polysaccharide biosynthesis predicted glycosyltransferase SpsG